jgi:asparagine synthase (glutamine-hydrolysing)
MCAIAGLYAFAPSAPPADRAQLRTIRDHMSARGPDGLGEWFSNDGRVALGHRRLAIIDLTEGGAQPMASADGQLVITFNGEIYNYRELRRELEAQGHVFRTESDTEVLLHLYQAKGTAMLQDLRGMYAFALWDAAKQALLLARDPFGIKPLYYTPTGTGKANNNGTLRFASQVKALLAGGHVDTAPEPAGHTGFFLWGSVPAPYTLYRGIRALPAGHYLWVSGQGATEPVPFCQITDILAHAANNPACGTPGDALDAIGAAVRSSIAAHYVADVPVGMFLSAGIDSALITALSVAHGERPHTLTLAFAEYVGTPNDESPLAEQLAAQFGTRHATVMVRKADFIEQREQLLAAMDQPSIDGVNTWFVSQAAASQGIKVALSGLGGDELFASYPSFADLPPSISRWRLNLTTLQVLESLSRLRASKNVCNFHKMQVFCMNANTDRNPDPGRFGGPGAVADAIGASAGRHAAAALQPGQSRPAAWRTGATSARSVPVIAESAQPGATPICTGTSPAPGLLYFVRKRVELSWLDTRGGAGDTVRPAGSAADRGRSWRAGPVSLLSAGAAAGPFPGGSRSPHLCRPDGPGGPAAARNDGYCLPAQARTWRQRGVCAIHAY